MATPSAQSPADRANLRKTKDSGAQDSTKEGPSLSTRPSTKERQPSKAPSVSGERRKVLEPIVAPVDDLVDDRIGQPNQNGSDRIRIPNPVSSDVIRPVGKSEAAVTSAAHRLQRKKKRNGGLAPYVAPRNRISRWNRARQLGRRGYVPLSPGKLKLRHRILPRTVIGIATMMMMLGIGAAFSGATFYAYYNARLSENERAVARFVEGFDQQFTDATAAIDDLRTDTITEIRGELKPLGDYVADADGVINLPTVAGPSVWMVETRDEDGALTAGSAFAVVEHGTGGTALVTSYSLVMASLVEPSPGIDLVKGNERISAQLWSWDAERDIAMVVVDRELPVLEFASDQGQLDSVGARLFALSGIGGNGATASPGVLLDHSQIGLQHTAPIGTLFRGGPLLNGDGKVLGVASENYRPFGIDPGDVRQAPDTRSICVVLLECSEIREEIVVEVAADETDAPLSDGEPVRDVPSDYSGEDSDDTTGDESTADDTTDSEDADSGSSETGSSESDRSESDSSLDDATD